MTDATPPMADDGGSARAGKIAFGAIVLLALGSTLKASSVGSTGKVAVVALGLTYFLVAFWQMGASRWNTALYLVFQNALAAGLVWIGFGATFLIPMPILSHAFLLTSTRYALLLAVLQTANWLAALVWRQGWGGVGTPLGEFLAAEIFVLVFTQVVLREREARRELASANQKLAKMAAQAEELATVKERNRLARELHDSVGHYLTIIHVQLQAAASQIDVNPVRATEFIAKATRLTHEGLEDVRRSVAALRLSPHERGALPVALAALVDELRGSGKTVDLVVRGTPRVLSPAVELTVYRTAQEALTNLRKHSHGARADVTLAYGPGEVALTVSDDGSVIADPSVGTGFGLIGVQERARLVGGALQIRRENGFTLMLTIPG